MNVFTKISAAMQVDNGKAKAPYSLKRGKEVCYVCVASKEAALAAMASNNGWEAKRMNGEEYRTRLAHGTRAIGGSLVPGGWQSQNSPRVARAERTHDDIVNLRCVFDHDQVASELAGRNVEFVQCGRAIAEEPLLERGVDPRARYRSRPSERPHVVCEAVHDCVHVLGVDDSFLHEQRFERLGSERVLVLLRVVIVTAAHRPSSGSR